MYKYDNGQISIDEFGQPVGMKLHAENRWVKKAMTIPWGAIEHRYAALFTNQKGNVAKPLRLGLGACIIQAEYGFSDVELTQMLQEHPYFQYFCGYKAYDDSKPPFDPSMMVYFRKERGIRLSGPALGRPPKDVQPDKKQNYIDECERVEVERRFSLAKRICGLGLITARLKETACHCIAMSILVLNRRKVQCAIFAFWCNSLAVLFSVRKSVFVQ